MPTDLGPFNVFVLDMAGVARHRKARLEVKVGCAFLSVPRALQKPKEYPLGDMERAIFTPGWLGTTLQLPHGKLLLPPRYKHLIEKLRSETRAANAPTEPRKTHRTPVRGTIAASTN
jgi:hypothetical protein